jgi:PIN domain nuclease of toxin-antitoxin system
VRLLLDTQAFLWFVSGDARLSPRARRAMQSEDAEVILSAASVWEIAIKVGLGRLTLPASVEEYVAEKVESGFLVLSIDWTHAAGVERLPRHHRDPFDRLLITQALAENLPVVTNDAVFDSYGVAIVW